MYFHGVAFLHGLSILQEVVVVVVVVVVAVVVVDRFCIALFSALEQTQCALEARDSE